jgi:hypothetical protein
MAGRTAAPAARREPVRSELIYLLVSLDKQCTAEKPAEPWEMYYARRMAGHFQPPGR